jgi:hypothetical protein
MSITDMMGDRSFLSGVGELLEAFENESPSMLGNVVARVITSYTNPGPLRDVREAYDPYQREMATEKSFGPTVYHRTIKSVNNAFPWWSHNVPPAVDAYGNDKTNNGSAYWRSMVPVRSAVIDSDPISIAMMSNNVPIHKPDHTIKLSGHPEFSLLAMDDGAGWVYRTYQEVVGKARHDTIRKVVNSQGYRMLVESGATGEGSEAQQMLRSAVTKGTQIGKVNFIEWLSGRTEFTPKVGGENAFKQPIQLEHSLNKEEYNQLAVALKRRALGVEYNEQAVERAKEEDFFDLETSKAVKGLAPEFREAPRF